jgi:hypothetical protein
MPDEVHEHLTAYISAAAQATARARGVLILIIVVTVLVFGSFWNSRQGSWISERIRATSAVLQLPEVRGQVPVDDASTPKPKQLTREQVERAREYLHLRPHLTDRDASRDMLRKLEEIQTQNVLYIRLPFFGLIVDVNDLGILGGFAFSVLLLWFRFALWHERANLEMTFAEAEKHGNRRFCYEALSMHQVLTVPRRLSEAAPVSNWSYAVKGLFFLPLAVYVTLFVFDCLSFQYGWSISRVNTVVGTALSGIFLLAIASLTFLCFTLSAEIDSIWRRMAEDISDEKDEEHESTESGTA